jgi:2-oxoglutarate/2-oxoacid ferredoxin oxidoreductase subunit alpha
MSTPKRIFVKGNEAISRGALAAGMKCFFGYPITPQNDIPEFHVLGPGRGRRTVRAGRERSGRGQHAPGRGGLRHPGHDLVVEPRHVAQAGGHLLHGRQRIPGVIVNVSRGGPGLGDIGPSQGDYFQSVKGGGHGDYKLLVLAPARCRKPTT